MTIRKFRVGGKVLVLLPTNSNELLQQWKGPYAVVEIVERMDYKVDVEEVIKMIHTCLLKQYVDRQTVGQTGSR